MKKSFFIGAVFLSLFYLVGCSRVGGAGRGIDGSQRTGTGEPRSYELRLPVAGTTNVTESKGAKIDVSNAQLGYAIVTCRTGRNKRLKVQIESKNKKYDFDMNNQGSPEVFGFTEGDGYYNVTVHENIDGTRYTPIATTQVQVKLSDPHNPFLIPNQYVNYSKNSQAIAFGYTLTQNCGNEVEIVDAVYKWIINNISYDHQKAASVQPGYLPSVDQTLAEKKGICFDYSALAAAILRSHGIPTKLITGPAEVGKKQSIANHAWNMIYLPEQGWVGKSIQFDGKNYKLVDTTLDAGSPDAKATYYENFQY